MAEQDTSPDADLQLKKRARRRLVGAIALALLAVIVLPMVMDREPRPPSQDIQVRIPSQDSPGLAARVVPGRPAATPMPAMEPKAAPQAEPDAKSATKASPQPATATIAVPPATADSPRPPAAKAPVNPASIPAGSAAKSEGAEKPAAKSPDAAGSAADAPAQWVVQLGAYRETGNVKLLLSKLKGVGVPAYTEKFESAQGPRTRVRAGPFASQDAAEKARTRIKIIGVDGPVAPR